MIQFKDFGPEAQQESWMTETWPPLDTLVAAMNRWAQDAAVEIVNVETVIVPALASGTASTRIQGESWQFGVTQNLPAYQFIRVWYRNAG